MNCRGPYITVSRFVADLIWIGLYQLLCRLFNSAESIISVIRSLVISKRNARQLSTNISISLFMSKLAKSILNSNET
jgi:hypothetical protein